MWYLNMYFPFLHQPNLASSIPAWPEACSATMAQNGHQGDQRPGVFNPRSGLMASTAITSHRGVPARHVATPIARWMVFIVENPHLKWMITGGSPILGNPNMPSMMIYYLLAFQDLLWNKS